MQERDLISQLHHEGFAYTYIWEDRPHTRYPDHTHRVETAHIVLTGEMTLAMNGSSKTYRAGDRRDVPANAVDCARMGPQGCRYLIGER